MRRRLLLARALMHEPRLVILDEPTAGVDYELRLELWRYIRRLHETGTTILLTTHYLEEAEELCEEIALIRDGRIIARDSAHGLRAAYAADSLAAVYVKAMAPAPEAPMTATAASGAARRHARRRRDGARRGRLAAVRRGVRRRRCSTSSARAAPPSCASRSRRSILMALWRPRLRGRSAADLRVAVAFGVVLGGMNWSIYESMDRASRSGSRSRSSSSGRCGVAVAARGARSTCCGSCSRRPASCCWPTGRRRRPRPARRRARARRRRAAGPPTSCSAPAPAARFPGGHGPGPRDGGRRAARRSPPASSRAATRCSTRAARRGARGGDRLLGAAVLARARGAAAAAGRRCSAC